MKLLNDPHPLSFGILPPGTTDAAMSWLEPKPDPYESDPGTWIKERLGEHIWSKQEEICRSVVENKYTAVKACHGPGKSFIAARIVTWWLSTNELGSAFAITTAPTYPQVQAILWREIRRAHRKSRLRGRITLECMWYMGEGRSDEELIAMGRKPADYDENAFQGIHARKVLVVLDEACGIPVALWNAVHSLVTNDLARVLAIGNPDDPASNFAQVCQPGSGYNVIQISAFDTPNFTGEYVPPVVADSLVSPGWVEERRADWGEGTNLWTAKILGEFPDVSDEHIITPAMIAKAVALDLPGYDRGRYGVDVARMGEDKTVIYRNRGGVIRKVASWAKLDTMQTSDRLSDILGKHGFVKVPVMVDSIGIGAGVYDRLRQKGHDAGAFEGSSRALMPAKFQNRRAESWWTFRRMLEDELIDLDPRDSDLLFELQNVKYTIDNSGRIVVESKDDMKKRGLRSPDHADAAILSTVTMGDVLRVNKDSIAGDLMSRAM